MPVSGSPVTDEWAPANASTMPPSGASTSSGSLFRFAQLEITGAVVGVCTLSVSELVNVTASDESKPGAGS